MRSVKIILLLACAALAGCSKPAPGVGYTNKNNLIQDYVAAVKAGDVAKIQAMVFTEGLSKEDIALNKENIEAGTQFALSGLHLKDANIKKIEEHIPIPGQEKMLQDRPVALAVPLTTLVIIRFETKVTDLPVTVKGGSNVSSGISLRLPIFERNGKYWIAPIAYLPATVKANERAPLSMGIELSKLPGVSIVRVEVGEGSSLSKSPDGQTVISWKMDAVELSWALGKTDTEVEWTRGLDALPEGNFKIEIKNLPKPLATVRRELVEAYEAAFGVKITTENYAWDGWLITAPVTLPAIFQKSASDTRHGWNTAIEGYAFRACVLDEIGDRIQGRLHMPVEFSHPFGNQRFDFTIACHFTDDDALLYGLKELGFKIEPKKLTRKTTVITPAK